MIIRSLFGLIALVLLSWNGSAQSSKPLSYKTQEDYCRDNPKMPTCIDGKPFKMLDLSKPPTVTLFPPPNRAPAAGAIGTVRSQPAAPVALADWRFSHPSPALLINVNIGSLLQSPVWTALASAWGAGKATEIEKVRAALSDIGQVLISVSPNGTANPSVLMLARGNVDGALGSMLRSGAGMQSKRLDAATMLIGDASSLQFANLRIRGPAGRTSWNSLQQAATREALKYDVWIGVDPRHLASMASSFGGSPVPAPVLAVIRGISLGVYLRDQLRMEASLDAPSPDVAERMLAAYQQAEAKRPAPKGRQVWVTVEGAKLRYVEIVELSRLKDLTVLDASTAQMLGPQIAPLIQALTGLGSAHGSAAAPSPKPAQQGGAIVIQGLDGGPREIPAK